MQSVLLPTRQRILPILVLVFLAPFIGEILFGSTHITTLAFFLPQMGVYGCGALLIREVVRRTGKGWPAILILGVAFAIAEECVILQSSLYPLFAADPQHIYGRVLGVNWLYLLWAIGYEAVWCIFIPIRLTELIFSERADEPWLGKVGMIVASIVFLASSAFVWFLWTQIALHRFTHGPIYQVPVITIAIALIVILLLILIALSPVPLFLRTAASDSSVPRPWLAGIIGFVFALFWFVLVLFHYGIARSVPFLLPLGLGVIWAAFAFVLIQHWSGSVRWSDTHRLSLLFGVLLASMLMGFLVGGVALPVDVIGKAAFNLVAVIALIVILWQKQQSQRDLHVA